MTRLIEWNITLLATVIQFQFQHSNFINCCTRREKKNLLYRSRKKERFKSDKPIMPMQIRKNIPVLVVAAAQEFRPKSLAAIAFCVNVLVNDLSLFPGLEKTKTR
ncbi:hypothetical protein CDAR_466451 [Caerostris darwini]|uniref:Uncharacterized protein n=1 Tax=Caerostris darwini TaxID=1538125 RepID=A0AAV4WQ12_9ARAC|nr:hypothetical protein CDAR_466451 [Caerostris darwini]